MSLRALTGSRRVARRAGSLFVRVDRALGRLAREPDAGKPLQGPLHGRRSFRVGTVRIIYRYEHNELLVLVPDIAQRQTAYR